MSMETGCSSTLGRRAATLIELIFFLVNVAIGVAVSRWAGARFGLVGYVAGFPVGFCGLIGVSVAICWLEDMRLGRPHFPVCRNGKCHEGDYQCSIIDDRFVHRCLCGVEYRRDGRRFCEVLPDGSLRPYLVWRPFRGWYPDERSTAAASEVAEGDRPAAEE